MSQVDHILCLAPVVPVVTVRRVEDAVPLARDGDGEIEIFTPEEMTELLSVASKGHIPFLAISAFAGVRHAELQRLQQTEAAARKALNAHPALRRLDQLLAQLINALQIVEEEGVE